MCFLQIYYSCQTYCNKYYDIEWAVYSQATEYSFIWDHYASKWWCPITIFVEYFYLFPYRNHCFSEKIPLGPNGTRVHFCQWFLSWNHKLLRILTYVSIIRDNRHLIFKSHILKVLYENDIYLYIKRKSCEKMFHSKYINIVSR